MGAREVIEKDNIETARQLLIAEAVGYLDDERFAKKAAVRELIGTLIAARNRGLSFERMAQLLDDAGVPITPGTLRAYFFELKTEKELLEENRKHAEKLAKVRRELGAKEHAENLQHAQEVAIEHVSNRSVRRPRVNAFANLGQPGGLSKPVPPISVARSPLERPASQEPSDSVPGEEYPEKQGVVTAAPAVAPVKPEPRQRAASLKPREMQPAEASSVPDALGARSIDEIAAASVGKDVAELEENLCVRDGGVWCESGKPYDGLLKAKQVHLLRTVGRLIAPTIGRSSGDFVAMSRDL